MRERLKQVVSSTIIEAAAEVFAERGLEARLEDVAARAGVAVGTLYNHFADRQALVDALFEFHRIQLRERLEVVVQRTEGIGFRERLEAILEELVAVSLPKLRLRMLFLQSAPLRVMKHAEVRARLIEAIGPILERARQDGELAPDPQGIQPQLLLGMTHSMMAATQESPPLLSAAEAPKAIVRAFLDGFGRRDPS